jgi:CUT domain
MSLDTADVAQHVREILSSNNIGQRLFARHVLGLSQGTVSELLSKPKHWDKLTEKGRESYRRMHQWIHDGANVAALKAYAPKKGKTARLSVYLSVTLSDLSSSTVCHCVWTVLGGPTCLLPLLCRCVKHQNLMSVGL